MQICVKPNFHSARNQTDQTRADQTSPVLQGWVYHSFGISFVYLSNQVLLVSKYPIWHSCSKKQSNASISEEMDFTWAEVTISTKCTLQQVEQKLFTEASALCFPIALFLLMLMLKPLVLGLKLELQLESKHCQRHNRHEAWVQLNKATCLGHITNSYTILRFMYLDNIKISP